MKLSEFREYYYKYEMSIKYMGHKWHNGDFCKYWLITYKVGEEWKKINIFEVDEVTNYFIKKECK